MTVCLYLMVKQFGGKEQRKFSIFTCHGHGRLNDYNVIKLYQLSSYGQMYMAGKKRTRREINILIKIRIENL